MQNETIQPKANYLIHLIYAGSFFLALLVFIGYEETVKDNKVNCIRQASKGYSEEWAEACKYNAKRISEGLKLCDGDASCKLIWGTPDPTPSCRLPHKMAANIDRHFEDGKKMCIELG